MIAYDLLYQDTAMKKIALIGAICLLTRPLLGSSTEYDLKIDWGKHHVNTIAKFNQENSFSHEVDDLKINCHILSTTEDTLTFTMYIFRQCNKELRLIAHPTFITDYGKNVELKIADTVSPGSPDFTPDFTLQLTCNQVTEN
jgi:hypothetical protein